jgi:sugar phosphate isomerase/epimerase
MMKKPLPLTRRDLLKLSTMAALGTTSLAGLADTVIKPAPGTDADLEIFIFSKHLQFLGYKDMSEAAKEMGFDGVDLTVRPKGHVLPENVAEDLPAATEAMASVGFSPRVLTTRVLDAGNPVDRKVLTTASQLGYDLYRTGWYRFSDDVEVMETARLAREHLQGLARLSAELGITGTYENHSGNFFGGSIWSLDQALKGLSPEHMGCQYDIMHATIEGGKNWPIGLRLIKDHINSLIVKDFKWTRVDGTWKPIYVPIGEGMLDFVAYFKLLKKYGINVPVILHCEYDLGGAEKGNTPSMDHKLVFNKLQNDLLLIRDAWQRAG